MQHKTFSKTEQQIARGVSLFAFLSDLDPYRFSVSERGYLLDAENPDWVGDIKKNWWYDNSKSASHKNGNIIDWLVYMSEGYTFPEAMNILLAYADGEDWRQYIRNNKTEPAFVPVDSYDYGDDLPFN